ncbi:MAG TPA: Rieske (2Fe-2S) protein [Rubrobacteraceae bacterium]|nr:Rieske (2Fe-2S) protein [Rubrobacteraceae bacterium]
MERISRERFIRVGAALGVSAASASVLAACGGGDSGSSGGGNSGGSTGSSGSSGEASTVKSKDGSGETTKTENASGKASGGSSSGAIASESEVATGSAKSFKNSGQPAVLVHLDSGDFVAYSAVCTHQGCTVAYKGGQLACPCHGSIFDPANGGSVVNGPAQQPLPEIPVKVEGGQVVKA